MAPLDLVLGAFHSHLRVPDDQTDRYLRGLANPHLHVLAHPRGRRFAVRYGLRADWRRIAQRAAEVDVAVEIDAHPDRQDLDVATLAFVREAGGRISIGSDAHRVTELAYLAVGVAAAIRAGLPRERVLNAMTDAQLRLWSQARRARAAA